MPPKPRAVEQILEQYVPNREEGQCWIWNGYTKKGYGWTYRHGKSRYAHRVIYEHLTGITLGEQILCHRCDTPACVNPEHLFPGDDADNFRDMRQKRRHAFGVRTATAKLTEAQVREARQMYAAGGWSESRLGVRFGVSRATIHDLLTGKTWRHIPLERAAA